MQKGQKVYYYGFGNTMNFGIIHEIYKNTYRIIKVEYELKEYVAEKTDCSLCSLCYDNDFKDAFAPCSHNTKIYYKPKWNEASTYGIISINKNNAYEYISDVENNDGLFV